MIGTSNVKEGYNPTDIIAQIKKAMNNYTLPEGYDVNSQVNRKIRQKK